MILCLIESHWVVLKLANKLKECYEHAISSIVWSPKKLSECNLTTKEQKPKYRECEDIEAFEDIWI